MSGNTSLEVLILPTNASGAERFTNMRIGKGTAQNFGSYKHLEFNYDSQGLALLYGATGSGKSTLQDVVCWVLFGVTAKGTKADGVRSWVSDGRTEVTAEVQCADGLLRVHRVRGLGTSDLYWMENNLVHRGKDLVDTQRLLAERLQTTAEDYISAAYFHEFSPAGSFFQAKAKERRELFDRLTDLGLPTKLAETIKLSGSGSRRALERLERDFAGLSARAGQLDRSSSDAREREAGWQLQHQHELQSLSNKEATFAEEKEADLQEAIRKAKLNDEANAETVKAYQKEIGVLEEKVAKGVGIPDVIEIVEGKLKESQQTRCPTCGGPRAQGEVSEHAQTLQRLRQDLTSHSYNLKDLTRAQQELRRAADLPNPYFQDIMTVESRVNHYGEQIEKLLFKENPYTALVDKYGREREDVSLETQDLEAALQRCKHELASLETLQDLTMSLRTVLLGNVVKRLESETNRYLETYFDAEIRVAFTAADSDKLDVEIYKNGHQAEYAQLSKGQRQLLKLCFAVSVMDASANRVGTHYDNLFFDESLDGLDTELKLKAYGLFQELSTRHSTVLVIDHSDALKECFDSRYQVELIGGGSIVSRQE